MSTKNTQTVKKFRGINQFVTKANLSPEFAEDCRNVIVDGSGGLSKFRVPVAITPLIDVIGPAPLNSFFNYEQGTGLRQIIVHSGQNLVMFDQNLAPFIVDSNPLNSGAPFVPFDYAEANNLLFMANNSRMIKWTGAVIENWGIATPVNPPIIQILGGVITVAGANRVSGVTTFETAAAHNLIIGDPVTTAGVADATFNYSKAVTGTPTPTTFTVADAQPNAASGAGTVVITGGYAVVTGKKWRYSYGNSVTGHESSASDPSASTGVVATATGYRVIPTASPDAQVDTLFIYGTLDGGGDFFLEGQIGLGVNYLSLTPDDGLNTQARAQLINNPPPVGKYLQKWAGRIFVFNLVGATHFIAYTGYERILRGRPEESCPPSNRLKLDTGSDEIRGGGVIQAGVIAFSKSNEMFMFRGVVEDITLDAPVLFTAFLEQLPFSEGLLSHYSCQASQYGLIYLASDKNVKIFNGVGTPLCISVGVHPILRRITPGAEENCRSAFFNYVDRDWYALLVPLDGSQRPNHILIFDLMADDNMGCFIIDQAADSIGVIEDTNSGRILCIGVDGQLFSIQTTSDTVGGVTPTADITSTANILAAFWRGGYYGNDTPQMKRMWRFGRVVTDQPGFQVLVNLINDRTYTFRQPLQLAPITLDQSGKFTINLKAKRAQVQINFPPQDISANVLEMQMLSIPLGDE